jgi:hypothetical protein
MRSTGQCSNPPSHPPGLDLETYSEATRRALYDIVVAVHFTAPAAPAVVARGDWFPDYSPDEAGLVVHFCRGRWLAWWTRLEEAASDSAALAMVRHRRPSPPRRTHAEHFGVGDLVPVALEVLARRAQAPGDLAVSETERRSLRWLHIE